MANVSISDMAQIKTMVQINSMQLTEEVVFTSNPSEKL